MVKYLLNKGADINTSDKYQYNVLYYAVDANSFELVTFFWDKVDIEKSNKGLTTLLCCAASNNNINMVKYLLGKGFDINEDLSGSGTALHYAVSFGTIELVELLISNGADINALDYKFQTPLMEAASCGKIDIARLLLEKGADPDLKNDYSYTALDIATQKEEPDADLIKLLEKYSKEK